MEALYTVLMVMVLALGILAGIFLIYSTIYKYYKDYVTRNRQLGGTNEKINV